MGNPAANDTTKNAKRRGRPRKSQTADANPRDSIIAVALDLFRKQGYTRTSMSEIARQAGMDPSSIYYWFPSKEAIYESLFKREDTLLFLKTIAQAKAGFAAKLYALTVYDVVRKCELPFDFIEVESIAQESPDQFKSFFRDYTSTYRAFVHIIEEGIAAGEFRENEADERAILILSINEGLQHHFHAKHRGELILEAAGYAVRNHTPEEIGRMSALSVIPSICDESVDLDVVREEGRRLYFSCIKNYDESLVDE